MLKVVVLLMLIVPSFYNFIVQRNNKIRVKKNSNLGFILAIFAFITSLIWYRIDKTLVGFLLILSAIILVYTLVFLLGIGNDGINVFMGYNPILKLIKFDQIKAINVGENSDNFDLTIKAFGDTYEQVYNIKDRDQIIKILQRNGLIKGDSGVR